MTMKRKFGAYMLLVFAMLGIVGIATGAAVLRRERDQVMRSMEAVAQSEARRVEDRLVATAGAIGAGAAGDGLLDALAAYELRPSADNQAAVDRALDVVAPLLTTVRAATLLSAEGEPIADTTSADGSRAPGPFDPAFVERAVADVAAGAPYVVGDAFPAGPGDRPY